MFLAVQIVLVVVGLVILTRGRFQVAGQTVVNPIASLVGIILTAQLPLALLLGIVLTLTDEAPAAAAGQPAGPVVVPYQPPGQPIVVPPATPAAAKADPTAAYWWVDPLITCLAVVMAAGLTGIGLRSDGEADELFADHAAMSGRLEAPEQA
jgi:Na+-driven multidrug efflux pump